MNLFALTSYSQNNLTYDGKKLFQIVEQKQNSSEQLQGESNTPANTISTFEINKNNCEYIFKYSGEILRIENFPINSIENGTVNLRRVKSAVDADTKWWRQAKSGLIAGTPPEIISYAGTYENDADTKIFLNYCGGNIFAYIRSTDGYQYDMVTVLNKDNPNSTSLVIAEQNHKIQNQEDVNPFECLTPDIVPETTEQADLFKYGNELQKDENKLYEVPIGIDAINNFFQLMGNDYNRTANYIASLMSHVSYLYEENFNVRLYIPYVLIREIKEEDPYVIYEYNDFEQKLTNMEWIWDGGFNDRPEKVALIFMLASLRDRPGGSSVAGLSYSGYPTKGVLCDLKYGFGIAGLNADCNFPNYNYTWDVNVVAHELGHNFGLQHTHSCYYQPDMIDTCVTQTSPWPIGDACLSGKNIPRPGTLMSYCHIANSTGSVQLKFHERERPLVRKAVQRAECFTEMKVPYIKILSPLVKNIYVAEDTIQIRWTTVKINKVNIFYSVNDGGNWVNIASYVSANDSIYKWPAPAIETDNMIFKIQDSDNSSTLDISNSRVKIIIPKISFITPSKKKEYSNREKMKFSWEANISKRFNGYFSSDNGLNWNKLFDNTGLTEFSYELPDITSESCILKVVDAVKNDIVALSPIFAVGEAFLDLSGPREGEILCAGRKYTITWTSRYLNSFLIEFSLNNGVDWKKSNLTAIEIDKNEYSWNIPDVIEDSMLIRAIIYDDRDVVVYTADHYFAIDTCAASIEENVSSKVLIEITGAKPNPMNNFVEFKISNNSFSQNAELSLINISGATVWKDRERTLFTGENIVHCDFSTIPQGEYYLILKNTNCNLSYPISIIR
ncbi:MAG: M12 family metallo-peptidase [bacterium]